VTRPGRGRTRRALKAGRSAATAAAAPATAAASASSKFFRLNDELHDLVLKRESTRALPTAPASTACARSAERLGEGPKDGHTTFDEVLRVITVTEK
jgi:hypothetical protein